jgi:hypothetical protein
VLHASGSGLGGKLENEGSVAAASFLVLGIPYVTRKDVRDRECTWRESLGGDG